MVGRVFRIGILFFIFIGVAGVSTYVTLTFFLKRTDQVTVPDLAGKHVVGALEILSELSLNTKVMRSEYSNDIPLHHVIEQEPEPGTELKKGRDVRIVLSKGSLTLSTPHLVGLSIQQAKIIIEENGVTEGSIASSYSADVKNDGVMAQSPEPETEIQRGRPIDLLISKGVRPREFIMPSLSRMAPEDAILIMDDLSLRLGRITATHIPAHPLNVVVDQEPSAGHRVEEGDTVHLVINRSPGQSTDHDTDSSAADIALDLFRYRLDSGFLKRHIKLRLNAFGSSIDLYDDFMRPNEEIWFLIPKTDDATLLLFRDDELILTRVLND